MMHAYDHMYLDKVSRTMGHMLHAAVIVYGYSGTAFLQQFIQSKIAQEIENGNPKYTAGRSGIELLLEVKEKTEGKSPKPILIENYERSNAYWVGWMLARYQWYSGRSFKEILQALPYDELTALYKTLHEADVQKAYDTFDLRFNMPLNSLQTIRKAQKLTQESLAEKSGISVNTIRAYERNSKDIKKAQADNLAKIAAALHCDIKDLF